MAVAANEGKRLRVSYVDDGSRVKGCVNVTAAQPQKTDLNEGIFAKQATALRHQPSWNGSCNGACNGRNPTQER
jgi:hypothetical protein